MTTNQLMNETVFPEFEKHLTDIIFCFIESNREMLNAYLDLLAEKDGQQLRYTNSQIAQLITARYGLENSGIENKEPNSKLIQAFHELKRKDSED